MKKFKFANILRYPVFRETTQTSPKSFFQKFLNILQENLEYGAVSDIPCNQIAIMIAEHIDSKHKSNNFLQKADEAQTIQELEAIFLKAVAIPEVIKQAKLSQVKAVPSDQTFSDFSIYLKSLWESAYNTKVKPTDPQLINKFKECLPRSLKSKLKLGALFSPKLSLFELAQKADELKDEEDAYEIERESRRLAILKINCENCNSAFHFSRSCNADYSSNSYIEERCAGQNRDYDDNQETNEYESDEYDDWEEGDAKNDQYYGNDDHNENVFYDE